MKNEIQEGAQEEFDVESIKQFMKLSAEEKLNSLEQLNAFLQEAMPQSSKDVWERLKELNF
jgi:hypothetical protein